MVTVLAIWLASGGFIGGFVQITMAFQDSFDLTFADAFYFANSFYDCYKEDLNLAGLIIGITVISILVLPGSILIILMVALRKLIGKLWKLFKILFRKKKRRNKCMNAKKCDICKTLYEQQYVPDVCITIYTHPYGTERVDLCPKCQEKLERFVSTCWQKKVSKSEQKVI